MLEKHSFGNAFAKLLTLNLVLTVTAVLLVLPFTWMILTSLKLIEEIGYRGKRVGGAMVSDKHANFIVNVGEAKARDVDRLIREIQEKISERYGIELITEVEKFNWNS